MELTPDTTSHSTSSTTRAIGRWALPAALFLALTTVGSAHGMPTPADHAAEFDPGSVCVSSPSVSPSVHQDTRTDALVIAAHAASIHAAR
jgi:hypothetical protein